MRLIRAARFAALSALSAGIYSLFVLRPFYLQSVQAQHAWWLAEDSLWQWRLGGWLWMMTIFAWMILLVALKHYYAPAHRISTALQSGLVVVGAILLIISVLAGTNRFGLTGILSDGQPGETFAIYENLVEYFALAFLGAGMLMGELSRPGSASTWWSWKSCRLPGWYPAQSPAFWLFFLPFCFRTSGIC
jgi:hypothetical protein